MTVKPVLLLKLGCLWSDIYDLGTRIYIENFLRDEFRVAKESDFMILVQIGDTFNVR